MPGVDVSRVIQVWPLFIRTAISAVAIRASLDEVQELLLQLSFPRRRCHHKPPCIALNRQIDNLLKFSRDRSFSLEFVVQTGGICEADFAHEFLLVILRLEHVVVFGDWGQCIDWVAVCRLDKLAFGHRRWFGLSYCGLNLDVLSLFEQEFWGGLWSIFVFILLYWSAVLIVCAGLALHFRSVWRHLWMRLFLIIGLFLIFVDLALAHQVIRGSHVKGRVKLVFASLTAHFQVQANARHRFTVSHSSFRQFRTFNFRHALDPLR